MNKRVWSLLLACALLAGAVPARAGSVYSAGGAVGAPMTVTVSCPDDPIAVGSEVTVTVVCEGAASLAVQVVQSDSSQVFFEGGTVVFTPVMSGTHAVKGYGLDASGEYIALSDRVDFTVAGEAAPPEEEAEEEIVTITGLNSIRPDPALVRDLVSRVRDVDGIGTRQAKNAKDAENNLLYTMGTDLLRIAMNPITGTYDLFADEAFDAQRREVLERAVIEMLYGDDDGCTTWNMATGYMYKSDAELRSEYLQNVSDGVQGISIGVDMAKESFKASGEALLAKMSLDFDDALMLAGRTQVGKQAAIQMLEYEPSQLDDLIRRVKAADVTAFEKKVDVKQITDSLEKLKSVERTSTQTGPKAVNTNVSKLEAVSKGLTVISVGLDFFSLYCDIARSKQEADRGNDRLQQQGLSAALAIAGDIMSKAEILDCLMAELDKDTDLYRACATVRADLLANFEGLRSTETRKHIVETGKYTLDFACKTTLNMLVLFGGEALSEAANTVGLYYGAIVLGAHGANFILGGLTEKMNSLSEATEALTYIQQALNSIKTDNMSFFMTELYYTLAKKRLDYVTERNYLLNADYWWSNARAGKNEFLLMSAEYMIVLEQGGILSLQNSIREDFYRRAGYPAAFGNRYYEQARIPYEFYLANRFDIEIGDEPVQQYLFRSEPMLINEDIKRTTVRAIPGWMLKNSHSTQNRWVEALFQVDVGGVSYCYVVDDEWHEYFVRAADIGGISAYYRKKYHFFAGDDGFAKYKADKDGFKEEKERAYGRFDMQYLRKAKDGTYVKVRDENGLYCWLRLQEVAAYIIVSNQSFGFY
ncbi:MAG: hypothetical protein IKP10_00410 [Clostridia bacterium]|nr:hypothetical protein [Clostridia bacterium]